MAIDTSDQIIGSSFRQFGSFAEKDIDALLHLLASIEFFVDTSIFLDVGANIGGHSIHALKHGFERAVCIEPERENFKLLRVNQILNDLSSRCHNICAAASIETGVSLLEKSPTNFGDHRVKMNQICSPGLHDEETWVVQDIATVTLDSIFDELSISKVGLAWIDTQGHEGYVLKSAKRLLNSTTPIVIEFWPYGLSRSGGWPYLLEVLRTTSRSIIEARESIKRNQLVRIDIEHLERLYNQYLSNERRDASPHTDLLLI